MERYAVESPAESSRRRLEEAGFDRAQAEALLHMISDSHDALATKQDLTTVEGALRQDIAEVHADLGDLATTVAKNTARIEAIERAMEALRQEVRDRFESFRQEIAGQIEGLRGEMRGELRAIKWLIGGMLAMMAPMAAGFIALALR